MSIASRLRYRGNFLPSWNCRRSVPTDPIPSVTDLRNHIPLVLTDLAPPALNLGFPIFSENEFFSTLPSFSKKQMTFIHCVIYTFHLNRRPLKMDVDERAACVRSIGYCASISR